MKKKLRTVLSLVLMGGALALPSVPARACAQGTSSNYLLLGEFPAESQIGRRFYYAVENAGSTSFEVHRISDDCSDPPTVARASYAVDDGAAHAGEDFEPTQGQTQDLYDPAHGQPNPSREVIPVPLVNDDVVESPVESATVRLFDPINAVLIDPQQAPLYIVDDDGPSRFSFGEASYSQSETNTIAKIPVFRAGDVSLGSSVAVGLSPTGDDPATEGKDYEAPAAATIPFPSGTRVQVVSFKIINDEVGEGPEQVAVDLGGPDASGITRTTLTILDNEESIAPQSRLHHPRQGATYPYKDYRIREIHVFTSDEGGSGVVRAQLGLRRKMTNGSCGWWNGDGFVPGGCANKRWVKMKVYDPGLFYYYRLPAIKPSKGTNVRNYKAFARAKDGARNVESRFVRGRNANAFEVARR